MRESFLKLLNGEKPDKIVWTADITYWISGQEQSGKADPAWKTEEGFLKLHQDLGVLPYYYYNKFAACMPVFDNTVELVTEKKGNKTINRTRTPAGELIEEHTFLPESCCSGCTRHAVSSEADLDILLYLLNHRHLAPINIDDYNERTKMWIKYDGFPPLGLPRSPLASLCVEWAGVENMVYLMMDCEEKVREALNLMEEQEAPVIDALCELAPPLVHFPDNLSSENLTSYYDEFMAPTHRRRLEPLHAAGVKCAVHLDGTIKGLLPKLVEVGIDAIEALTPKPVGDVDIEQIQQLAGSDTVILWGGVPGAMFSPPFTWEQMETHIKRLMECWGGRPWIMGVADQVPPDGDIEFCKNIAELIKGA